MKSASQLQREIDSATTGQLVDVRKLFAWAPKVRATIADVAAGRTSRSNHIPVDVSRLDSPRGAFWIMDGHHRVVEAAQRGDKTIRIMINDDVPRIERTGGAYASVLSDRVNVFEAAKEKRR